MTSAPSGGVRLLQREVFPHLRLKRKQAEEAIRFCALTKGNKRGNVRVSVSKSRLRTTIALRVRWLNAKTSKTAPATKIGR
mgnify:CR=1 FL=1